MYICRDYEHVFERPHIDTMYHDELEGYFTESFESCPYCNSSFDEAYECLICGEYKFRYELDEDHICDDCNEELEDEKS